MIWTFANQKGGVGKTASSVNIAYELVRRNKKVLLVDTDPSKNMTICVGFREQDGTYNTLYNLYSSDDRDKDITIHDVIYETKFKNLDIIPSGSAVAWVDRVASTESGGDIILRELLEQIKTEYDFIVIDTPPTLSKILDSALIAADHVIVPIQCEYLPTVGMTQLLRTITLIRKRINPKLKIGGAFANMYDARINMSNETIEIIKHFYEDKALQHVIRINADIPKAQREGVPIQEYKSRAASSAIQDYEELVDEVFKLNGIA